VLRKALVLLAPIAVLVGVALSPVSASADRRCPKGTSDPSYCEKRCVVPELQGLTVRQAKEALEARDCKLGDVEQCQSSESGGDGARGDGKDQKNGDFRRNSGNHNDPCTGVSPGRVIRSEPPTGTVLSAGSKVDVIVRKGGDQGHD
jgi:hypothetical protein